MKKSLAVGPFTFIAGAAMAVLVWSLAAGCSGMLWRARLAH